MKIGIYGYGNLGRGAECAALHAPDTELIGIFTRRDPAAIKTLTGAPVYSAKSVTDFRDTVDVMILCGGSATDLPETTPLLAADFCVVDSFDHHAHIPYHFERVDAAARAGGRTALISAGWDPGLFSLNRLFMQAVLPTGKDYTFWGRGVSQGHSDAIRRIPGVKDARQYTVPVPAALERVRAGEMPELVTREKHTRECFVVPEEGADLAAIENAIRTMPDYFADYDTTVTFISLEELKREHSRLPHGGTVLRSGRTGLNSENTATMEYSLKLDSNPEFTAGAMLAYARAVKRMHDRGVTGCLTVFDVAPADLSLLSPEELRASLL